MNDYQRTKWVKILANSINTIGEAPTHLYQFCFLEHRCDICISFVPKHLRDLFIQMRAIHAWILEGKLTLLNPAHGAKPVRHSHTPINSRLWRMQFTDTMLMKRFHTRITLQCLGGMSVNKNKLGQPIDECARSIRQHLHVRTASYNSGYVCIQVHLLAKILTWGRRSQSSTFASSSVTATVAESRTWEHRSFSIESRTNADTYND